MTKQEETFDMPGFYRELAKTSDTFSKYSKAATNGLALLCMGLGRIPDGSGYGNFIKAWKDK